MTSKKLYIHVSPSLSIQVLLQPETTVRQLLEANNLRGSLGLHPQGEPLGNEDLGLLPEGATIYLRQPLKE
jgi:hypothetical protein